MNNGCTARTHRGGGGWPGEFVRRADMSAKKEMKVPWNDLRCSISCRRPAARHAVPAAPGPHEPFPAAPIGNTPQHFGPA